MSNIHLDITDDQWYNFICGMITGTHLKQEGAVTAYQYNLGVPWAIGGEPNIGLEAADVELFMPPEDGFAYVPVSVHSCNIGWSGFLVNVTIDQSAGYASYVGVESDLFENLQVTAIPSGNELRLTVRYDGTYDSLIYQNEILFNIKFRISTIIPYENDTPISFNTESYLLTWREYQPDEWGLFGITPSSNIDGCLHIKYTHTIPGEITQEEKDQMYTNYASYVYNMQGNYGGNAYGGNYLGGGSGGSGGGSSPGGGWSGGGSGAGIVSSTSSSAGGGGLGGFIGMNPNPKVAGIKEEDCYFICEVDHVKYLYDESWIGCNVECSIDALIVGHTYTLELDFVYSNCDVNDFTIEAIVNMNTLSNINSWYFDNVDNKLYVTFTLSAILTKFNLFYMVIRPVEDIDMDFEVRFIPKIQENQLPADCRAVYYDGLYSGLGHVWVNDDCGTIATGQIYSSTKQLIYLTYNNCVPQYVMLYPGYNDVNIWLPYIGISQDFGQAFLEFKCSGYVFIPVGLSLNTSSQVPYSELEPVYRYEEASINDEYEVSIVSQGVYDEDIVEDINIRDVINTDLIQRRTYDESFDEDVEVVDTVETDLIQRREYNEHLDEDIEVVDTVETNLIQRRTYDEHFTEEATVQDIIETKTIGPTTYNETFNEDASIVDEVSTSIERPMTYRETLNEDVTIEDTLNAEVIQRITYNETLNEDVTINDEATVRKE